MLWAAQALVDNDYTDGPESIPTVVFAALSAEERLFEELRESLAALEWTSEQAGDLLGRFTNIFAPYAVWALADGVLIIRPKPIALRLLYKGGKREFKVIIDVVDVSVKPEQVAELYKVAAKSGGFDTDFYEEAEGGFDWQVAPGILGD